MVNHYSGLGTGVPFARYMLNRLHNGESNSTQDMTLEEAVKEAVYVIEEVKKVQLHCGGETHVVCIRQNGRVQHRKQNEIKGIIRELESADLEINKRQRKMMSFCPHKLVATRKSK